MYKNRFVPRYHLCMEVRHGVRQQWRQTQAKWSKKRLYRNTRCYFTWQLFPGLNFDYLPLVGQNGNSTNLKTNCNWKSGNICPEIVWQSSIQELIIGTCILVAGTDVSAKMCSFAVTLQRTWANENERTHSLFQYSTANYPVKYNYSHCL